MAKPSKMLGKGPDVPAGGRMNPLNGGGQKLPKVKLPAKGSSPKETSTRKAGPK